MIENCILRLLCVAPGKGYNMTLNEKMFNITLTENEVTELHKLLNDLSRHYKELSEGFGDENYQKSRKAKGYRNEFAILVNTSYMGDDA